MIRSFTYALLVCAVALGCSSTVHAQIEEAWEPEAESAEPPLIPDTLSDALSCRSYDAALAFGFALFLDRKPPEWMSELGVNSDETTGGMIGLHGYQLREPVSLHGHAVDRVYFLKDWVVTLWPRDRAEVFIREQEMERAPIRMTEQYYRFIDPEAGPMLGAFEPTGGSIADMFARALGAEPEDTPPSEDLFVGCNYTVVSQQEFLGVAAKADNLAAEAASDFGAMLNSGDQ